jgi:hypothetical protein
MTTFNQQLARRYIRITQQPRCGREQQARIRAFFNHSSSQTFKSDGAIFLILLHFSFILFLIGASIYLHSIHRNVFFAAIGWFGYLVAFCCGITSRFSLKPILKFIADIADCLFPTFFFNSWFFLDRLADVLFGGKWKEAARKTSKQSSKFDAEVLEWAFDRLDDDDALEKFLESIPGFFASNLVKGVDRHLSSEFWSKFRQSLNGFLDRTFSISSVPNSVRSRRLVTSLDAFRATPGSIGVLQLICDLVNGRWPEALHCVEIGHSLRWWDDGQFSSYLRRANIRIISCARERDDRWKALIKDEVDISDHVLQEYLVHGDSVSLATFIYFVRQLVRSDIPSLDSDPYVLRSLSRFDICDTLPGLQHDFCSLWNELVQEARNRGAGSMPTYILKEIRHIYASLHLGTDSAPTAYSDVTPDDDSILFDPSSYPLCRAVEAELSSSGVVGAETYTLSHPASHKGNKSLSVVPLL